MTTSPIIEPPEVVAPPIPPGETWMPPGEDDLPSDDGVPMETAQHRAQMNLLIETLELHDVEQHLYVGGNMFVYYRALDAKRAESVGPDVYVVIGAEQRARKSWVVWGEGKGPDVVIELLSESTAAYDRTGKKQLYQDMLRVPEYFYADPFSDELAGFTLVGGLYQSIQPNDGGRLVSKRLQLALGRWQGTIHRMEGNWLRWYTLDGRLLLTSEERAEQERTRAEELAALLARYREQFGPLDESQH